MKYPRMPWILDEVAPESLRGKEIHLITEAEPRTLPAGTMLVTILGRSAKVGGSDRVDLDTRGGFLAYGIPVGWQP